MSSPTKLTLLLAATLLAGCTMAPHYDRPDMPVSSLWPFPWKSEANAPTATELGWKDFFLSDELRSLIDKGLRNNRDLRIAVLNIDAARAQYHVTRSDLFPSIDANGTITRQHTPETTSATGQGQTSTTDKIDIGTVAFELDLFGRLRSLNKSAFEDYLATEEAKNAVQISLVAEISKAYLQVLSDREQQALAQKTLEAQQESFDIVQKRFDAGISNQLDLSQAKTLLETAHVNTLSATRLVGQDRNALELLVGAPVLDTELAATFDKADQFVSPITPGLPSDLLQNRPDIRAAEHTLKAANADIGAARAAFFPSISLTGNGGSAATALSDLFTKGSGTWAFIPQITMPIFSGGRNKANLDLSYIRKDISIAQYEKAIQSAFRDVADALIARQTLGDELAARVKLVDAATESARLADLRYQKGVAGYSDVLSARQNLYGAQQTLINKRLAMLENYITFYTALGGGQQAEGSATAAHELPLASATDAPALSAPAPMPAPVSSDPVPTPAPTPAPAADPIITPAPAPAPAGPITPTPAAPTREVLPPQIGL